ncbi:MAG TPA: ATP-grasp domain-containing protein [Patescibacteria group bacterium]|nr:ATP-grasp domain-containing protein [Patescibacteria group bacterium]
MDVIWAIENWKERRDDVRRLVDSCMKLGISYFTFPPHQINYEYDILLEHDKEECVVFFGSIRAARIFRKEKPWIPGAYFTEGHYDCTYYFPRLGELALNSGNCIMLPYGSLLRQQRWLFNVIGRDSTVFIRPNRGIKEFTGALVREENFVHDVDLMGFHALYPESLVVISIPFDIEREWRFVVVGQDVVTGSLYKENGKINYQREYPPEALEVANEAARRLQPDIVWVCDVCETKQGKFKVLEIGSLSCCGLYACDTDIVVEYVSQAAWKEFEEINETSTNS